MAESRVKTTATTVVSTTETVFTLGDEVTEEYVDAYIASTYPTGLGTNGYMSNVIDFLKTIVLRPITGTLLMKISGKTRHPQRYAPRRWEEISSLKGYPLVNWKDPRGEQLGLKYSYWCLLSTTATNVKKNRGVNKKIRSAVFMRDGSQCTRCGAKAGELYQGSPDKIVHLHVGHLVPFVHECASKKYTVDDFTTLCSMCNEGEKATVTSVNDQITQITNQIENLTQRLAELYLQVPSQK